MSTSTPNPIPLTQDQADKILTYALENRMYECGTDGLAAVDPQTRLNDAATLAFQARRAWQNGNQTDPVKEVLFLAEVDMAAPATNGHAAAVPAPAPAPVAPVDDPYVSSTDEQLQQALQAFRAVPSNPAIQAEIDRVEAVLSQRSVNAQAAPAAQPAQEVAPAPQPPAPPAAPGPIPAEPVGQQPAAAPAPVAPVGPPAVPVPVPGGQALPHTPPAPVDLPPVPGLQRSGVISPGGVPDAPGSAASAPPADAGTVPGPQAPQPSPQGVTPPAAPPAQGGDRAQLLSQITWDMMTAYGLTVESAQALSDDQIRSIIANPGGAGTPAPAPRAVSVEREELEAKVTGAMLKAWKHGRKDVPGMTDEYLSTMVANPGGPSTVGGGPDPADQQQQPVPAPPAPTGEPAPAVVTATPDASPQPEQPAPSVAAPALPSPSPATPSPGVTAALEIIAQEHFPIPPDIEEPYRLPNDVSKVSDDELRSLHARAHAVEARINWVISECKDEIGDLELLLSDRRRVVKLETPTTADGKRLTKDQIEARVEADEQVQSILSKIKQTEKKMGKLRVIADNAHRDCERLSRQWSMRFSEEKFSPAR